MKHRRNTESAIAAAISGRGAARRLGISPRRISKAIKDGELIAFRVSERRFLVRISDLDAWLAKFEVRPSAAIEARAAEIIARDSRRPTAA